MTTAPPIVSAEHRRIEIVRIAGVNASFDVMQIVHSARRFAPHFYSTYAFGVVESGTCQIATPRGSWLATRGSLLAYSPGELHQAAVVSDEPFGYRMAYLTSDLVRHLVRSAASSAGPVIQVPVAAPSLLTSAFTFAHRDLMVDPGRGAAEGQLLTCIRQLVSMTSPGVFAAPRAVDIAMVEHACAYLRSHLGRRVHLEDVGAVCGVTPFRLIRVFRRVTGLSPHAYLILLRVNQARLLLDRGVSVSHAAYSCGFSDQSHLTRTFKRTLGLPPGQYLRSIRPAA